MQKALWSARTFKDTRRRLQLLFSSVFLMAFAFLVACPGGPSEPPAEPPAAKLVALQVAPPSASVFSGEKQAFTATGVFSDSTTQDLTTAVAWSAADSSGSGVATIEPSGVATGTATGSAIITASYQDKTDSAVLQVSPPVALLALTLSPARPAVALSTTQQFTLTGIFVDGTTRDVTAQASWVSVDVSGSNVATISASGLATAHSSGQAAITASYQGQSAATTLQVNNVTLVSLALSPSSPVVAKDLTVQLRALGTFSDGSQQDLTAQCSWSAADGSGSDVATVSPRGLVTARSAGTATITAALLGKSASVSMTVRDVTLSALDVLPAIASINKNVGMQFTARATYSDGSTQDVSDLVEWKATDVSGTSVASISSTGLGTGRSAGSASITARYGGKTATSALTVSGSTLPAPVLSAVTPARATTTGGSLITLQGENFIAGDTVRVASAQATNVMVVSATQITAVVPAVPGAFGLVPVSVTHPDGQSVTRADLFSFSSSTLSYAPASTIGVATYPGAVAVGDFNGDGKTDLIVNGDTGGKGLQVLPGAGNGTFGAATYASTANSPGFFAAADFNNDGKLDLVAVHSSSNSVSVLLGVGNGSFQTPVNIPVGTSPYDVKTGDFNSDGKLDFVVTNSASNSVSMMLGDGIGGFSAGTPIPTGTAPSFLVVHDLNNDAKPDLLIGLVGSVLVRLGVGNGTFTAGPTVTGAATPYLAAGDLNVDGKADLITVSYLANKIEVRIGQGDGTFGTAATLPSVPGPRSPLISDINGDGKADLALTTNDNASVYLGTGIGSFGAALNMKVGSNASTLVSADLNGDKKPDLLCTNNFGSSLSILLNTSQ